jgi:hypothetical protein
VIRPTCDQMTYVLLFGNDTDGQEIKVRRRKGNNTLICSQPTLPFPHLREGERGEPGGIFFFS